ncbi:MAG: alpha-beta hydrolase superfamily lysophospholipase [Pseudohongiellaceae bacterium]|jgi:alpha-beta hydrolase superfamily lysophospholipase
MLSLIYIFMSGCTSLSSLLFYPKKQYIYTPEKLGLHAERISITTKDGEILANWLLNSPIEPKGTILFLHGNGENISTHIRSVAWLPQHGYEVFLLDYRGYGQSTGSSTLSSALSDIEDAHRWLSDRLTNAESKRPLFIFGQSLGGALAITYTANYQQGLSKIEALISESAPASWPQVAREAMRSHWITWLLQIPASLLPGEYDPEDHISKIATIPILIMHSQEDTVVEYHHGQQLFEKVHSNATWLETTGGHIAGLHDKRVRQSLLGFLANSQN